MGSFQTETTRTTSLIDKVADRVIEKLQSKTEEKRGFSLFNLFRRKDVNPLEKKLKLQKSKLEKNYVLYIWIYPNGQLRVDKVQPTPDNITKSKHRDTYHMFGGEYVMRYGKYPVVLQYVDSVEPVKLGEKITPEKLAEEVKKYGKGLDAQTFMIKVMELSALSAIKKGGAKILLWIIIGVVVLYLITQLFGVKVF